MHNRRGLFLFCFLAGVLFLAAAAQAAAPAPLKVLAIHPTGPTPRVKQVTVTFDQPMVALGDMDRSPEEVPVQLDPALSGRFRWLNVYTLAFEPDQPLDGSIQGKITVKRNARSLSGGRLAEDVTVDYSLPTIALEQSDPKSGTSGLALRPDI